ncbi:MAG: hypothetical protein ABJA82_19150 [Myxococcales bacterium]
MSFLMLLHVAFLADIAAPAPSAPEVPPTLETPGPAPSAQEVPPPLEAPAPSLSVVPPTPEAPQPAPSVPAAPPTALETRWYGWQLLLADVASIYVLANSDIPTAGRVGGFGSLVLTAPVLHVVNHNMNGAIASLAVRGGVTLLAFLITRSEPEPCPQGDPVCPAGQIGGQVGDAFLALGLLLGGVIFAVVDDTVLAKVSVPSTSSRPAPASSGSSPIAGLAPFIAPTAGGLSCGLGGAF